MTDNQTLYCKSTILFSINTKQVLITISWIISNLVLCQIGIDKNGSLYISKNQ